MTLKITCNEHYPWTMDADYLAHITAQDNIKLVIMGKDPFPEGATGIPFCKSSWEEQLNPTSSGFVVFRSLGLTEPKGKLERFTTPSGCFFDLAMKGIVFLNLSYCFIGGPIRKQRHRKELIEGFKINEKFLKRAGNIVICGEANKNRWNGFDGEVNEVVHPDIRNGISQYRSIGESWLETWSFNSLNKLYTLNL